MGDSSRSPQFISHQFKPGQSGNPGGRPRLLVTVTEAAIRLLNGEAVPPKPRPKTWDVAAAIIKRSQVTVGRQAAHAGPATEQLLERTEGVPVRRVEFENKRPSAKPIDMPEWEALAEAILHGTPEGPVQ